VHTTAFDAPRYSATVTAVKCAVVRGTGFDSASGLDETTRRTGVRRGRRLSAKLGPLALFSCTFLYGCSSPSADANVVEQRSKQTQACDVFKVVGPTVIAFFDYENALKNPDAQDALDDFRFFLEGLREQIDQSVIRIHECQRPSFEVEADGRRLKAEQSGAGYYMITPGKDARVERGVVTENDLIVVMREYFGAEVVNKALTPRK